MFHIQCREFIFAAGSISSPGSLSPGYNAPFVNGWVSLLASRNHLFFLCVLLPPMIWSGQVNADFASAADAYRRNDYATAMELLMPLAKGDDARAQNVVALMYKYGEGVDPNAETAFNWYLRAAKLGYPPAQYQVGVMLTAGMGTPMNPDEAEKWLIKAAGNGYQKANDKLASSNQSQSPLRGQKQTDFLTPWSQQWDLTLPNEIRFSQGAAEGSGQAGFRVQLAAMGSPTRASQLVEASLRQRKPALFEDLEFTIQEVKRDRTYYRLQAGPFANMAAARFFCERMAGAGLDTGCLPIGEPR